MYHYILDNILNDPKYNKTTVEIHSLINKHKLTGNFYQISPYSELQTIISKASIEDKDTVCVIGDENLFIKTINIILKDKKNPFFSFIPITNKSNFLNKKIDTGNNIKSSIQILSKRKHYDVNSGEIDGGYYFINQVSIINPNCELKINNQFTVNYSISIDEIKITNPILEQKNNLKSFKITFILKEKTILNTKKQINSVFFGELINITPKSDKKQGKIIIDNYININSPLSIKKGPSIKIIGR